MPQLNPPSIDQTQLRENESSQKYANITDMKLVWRQGKPALEALLQCTDLAMLL